MKALSCTKVLQILLSSGKIVCTNFDFATDPFSHSYFPRPYDKILVFMFLRVLPSAFLGFLSRWAIQVLDDGNCSAPTFLFPDLFIVPIGLFVGFFVTDLFFYSLATTRFISSSLDSQGVFLLVPKFFRNFLPTSQPLLILAAHSGHREGLQSLLDGGAKISTTDKTNKVALFKSGIYFSCLPFNRLHCIQ